MPRPAPALTDVCGVPVRLSPAERAIADALCDGPITLAEIARLIGISEGYAKVAICNIRAKLHDAEFGAAAMIGTETVYTLRGVPSRSVLAKAVGGVSPTAERRTVGN